METILLHIEYLTQRHDCVILPGLGALIATRRSAEYVEATGEFLPPVRKICFNPAVKSDDGLIADSIRRREHVSFEESRLIVRQSLDMMNAALERDGEVTLGKIGTLRQHEGTLTFRPMRKEEEEAIEIGLLRLQTKSAKNADHSSFDTYNIEDKYEAKKSPKTSIGNEEAISEEKESQEKKKYIQLRIRRSWLYTTAATIAILIAVCMGIRMPKTETVKTTQASVVPVATAVPTPTKGASAVETVETGEYFQLVVGSFRNKSEAETFVGQHERSAYGLQIEEAPGMWLIIAASSSEKAGLLSLSREKGFQEEYKESWIRKAE
ncbi:MAG: hypothetical protein NC097_07950 [Clostridium sp.]|nr:hypothetical protein [Prevotella sp.]MCM1429712.1 hypothetical protein [Clostridium sp.]MCM1474638.1 hypothetical protein [Muribaculaceae bacterium]